MSPLKDSISIEHKPAFKRLTDHTGMRLGCCLLLVLILFSASFYAEQLYAVLGTFCQRLFDTLGLTPYLPRFFEQGSVISQTMNRPHSIPAVILYSLLYVTVCLALLFLLLPYPRQRRYVLFFYGITSIISLLLLVTNKLVGPNFSLTIITSHLLHFLVSPVPVIILVPLLRWYSANTK
ncbi:XrtX-associated membrane protein [Hymenobacter radiodurans]|uniref:XrtX-associated membrane protein n=1 Tax=Hymenobacter radiodurans TaxID=2496028 RepID=UPI003743FE76